MFLRRVRSVDGEPIMCQESWLNLNECPGLADANFEQESLFDLVERCSGAKIKFSRMTYSARVAGVDHASSSAATRRRRAFAGTDYSSGRHRPIEWSTTWLKPVSPLSQTRFNRLGVQRFPWSVRFRRCCVHLALGCVRLVKVVARCIQNKAKMGVEMDNKSRNRGGAHATRASRRWAASEVPDKRLP